jgi:hypothetical protein
MKAKSTVPEKGERLESPKVEPSKQPVAQTNEEGAGIDLSELSALDAVNDTLEKLFRTDPSIIECEDEGRAAYRKACALLTYADYADIGLQAENSALAEPMAGEVMDSIRLQLDIVRLAGKRLYSICQAHDSRESGDSRKSDNSSNS